MNLFASRITQHVTHGSLTPRTGPRDVSLARLDLDAIIVPASRTAQHLDHAVTLARAAGCWLLVLCSRRLHSADVTELLAARSYDKAVVVDLPPGYSHDLLDFPGLRSIKDELPEECSFYVTDLSMKRNVGLVLARMLKWRHIFFLDDDIRDITYPDLQRTVDMLGSFSAAGLWVTDFPDNSIVCHANRVTKGSQDVFVSGAALAVDCDADIGFFPDIYNEDWLFFFDDASRGRLANSRLKATQLRYYPFANPQLAAWQEFGDVIAEGLYALLHLGLKVEHATREYWTYFLEARRNFLEDIATRARMGPPDLRDEMLFSVESALKCLLTIKPDLCERYIEVWRKDLAHWKRRAAGIPAMSSVAAALQEMQLPPSAPSGVGRILPCRAEATPEPEVAAGPVAIPRFDTLKKMSEHASTLQFGASVPVNEKRDTIPFPVLTQEYSPAMLTAGTNGYSPWTVDPVGGRQRRQRLGGAVSWLVNARPWRRSPAQPTPRTGPGPGEWAAPEPEAQRIAETATLVLASARRLP